MLSPKWYVFELFSSCATVSDISIASLSKYWSLCGGWVRTRAGFTFCEVAIHASLSTVFYDFPCCFLLKNSLEIKMGYRRWCNTFVWYCTYFTKLCFVFHSLPVVLVLSNFCFILYQVLPFLLSQALVLHSTYIFYRPLFTHPPHSAHKPQVCFIIKPPTLTGQRVAISTYHKLYITGNRFCHLAMRKSVSEYKRCLQPQHCRPRNNYLYPVCWFYRTGKCRHFIFDNISF